VEPETHILYNGCKACGSTEKIEKTSKHIYNNNNTLTVDKGSIINSNPYITHDITLPKITKNKNIKCNNELCTIEETDITYIKYDSINMKYIYICNHCGSKWKNNI
jgi:DNA-directed RNA polymerase subunit M/transcription elongation factor TFIIS